MELEDLSSEHSELEEGEINDDVEIISEVIHNHRAVAPSQPVVSHLVLNKTLSENSAAYLQSDLKKSNNHSRNSLSRSSKVNQRTNSLRFGSKTKRSPAVSFSKQHYRKNRTTVPERTQQQPKPIPKAIFKSNAPEKTGTWPSKPLVVSEVKAEQSSNFPIQSQDQSNENKWRNTFEVVHSASSDMSISTEDEEVEEDDDDEVMLLRLEALNSLDSNVKPKVIDSLQSSAVSTPTSEPTNQPVVQEEEEDEELLRAKLLIEVARKQTAEAKLEESKAPEPANAIQDRKPEPDAPRPTRPSSKNTHQVIIPKADRLVIDLRNDSDTSSDEEGTDMAVENSITALLKSARQTVEQKVDARLQALPQALSHLPRHQQEEYQRLKQEIVRRERLNHMNNNSKPATPTGQTEDNVESSRNPTVANSVPREVVLQSLKPPVQKPAMEPPSVEPSKEETKASLPNPVTPRIAALKQQVVRRKRDLALTKAALQKQLELVDKHRTLWMKSSQEVIRLKAMLQQAEDTEKQLRQQFTNSQQQTQRLKTRMQSVERGIVLLQNGLSVNRPRRTSFRMRTVSPKTSTPIKSVVHSAFPFSPANPLKVKPKIVAKALAKTSSVSRPNHVKPSATLDGDTSATSAVQNLVHLTQKLHANLRVKQKKTLTDEQWLFGTLGDEWDDVKTDSSLSPVPVWVAHSHTSKSSCETWRLDPKRVVCRYDLDSTCQDATCSFQHLPSSTCSSNSFSSSLSVGTTSSVTDSIVATAAASSQVAKSPTPISSTNWAERPPNRK